MASQVNIGKLLAERKLEILDDIGKLKCVNCKLLLNNPCRLSCNCKYCRVCIDDMVANAKQICSGSTENCELASLSQFLLDCKTSSKILKLRAKCPEELCSHECKLIDMEGHLEKCTEKTQNCPFSDMGCEMQNINDEKLKSHFETEICSHNRMLIEMISNLKNEISVLRKELIVKDSKNESINEDIQQFKEANQCMVNEVNSMREELELLKSENVSFRGEIESVKSELNNDQLYELEQVFESKLKDAMQKWEENEEISKTIDELRNTQVDSLTRIEMIENCLKKQINADFVWITDAKTMTDTVKYSEIFLCYSISYVYQLELHNLISGKLLTVQLQIVRGFADDSLNWPFRGRVTINIIDKCRPKMCKSITRVCQIKRPVNKSSSSEKFIFDYSDWIKAGISVDNGVLVSFSVVLDN